MAGPKKSKNAVMDRGTNVTRPGTPVKIIAMGGAAFTCPTCSKQIRNGMLMRYEGIDYCCRHCMPVGTAA